MTSFKILQYPDPFLRRVAREVLHFDDELARMAEGMIKAMDSLHHCIGVAATQIGIDRRILVMNASRREKSSQGLLVMINPIVRKKEGSVAIKEGCLSLPNFLGRVQRAERVDIAGRGLLGEERRWTLSGLDAICAQHEIDHLNGILFIDRLHSLRADLFLRRA